MKKKCFAVFLLIPCLLLFVSCGPNVNYIRRVQSLEENVSQPQTAEELTEAIKKYENRVEDIMAAENQIGIWYKILATRYIDNKMYGKALDSLQNAVRYYPANQNLYYYIGVCAGYMAKSELDYTASGSDAKKQNYLKLSESAYLRALELEPGYARALYGLGVLYAFDFMDGAKAIPPLVKLLSIEKKHTDAMFVLARAYFMEHDFQNAADMYDAIIRTTTAPEKKSDAEKNKKTVLDAMYAEQYAQ